MKYEVLQRSHYKYSLPVSQSINHCLFKPLSANSQTLLEYDLMISPKANSYSHVDYWGNDVTIFYIWEPHNELIVETKSVLHVHYEKRNILLDEQIFYAMKRESFRQQFAEFLKPTAYTTLSEEMLQSVIEAIGKEANPYIFLQKLNEYIFNHFSYVPGATHVKTIASEAFAKKSGVCQDFSHVMLSICRHVGIPARYVSGYIYGGEDAAMRGDSQTHAWVEGYIPEYGWIGFDPTNNMMAKNQHICVATGRDYGDITPLKGVYMGNGTQELSVSISVSRLKDNDKICC